MPMDDLIAAAGRVLSTDRTALLYGDRQGYAPLRELVAHKAMRLESLEVDPDDVLITNGSGQAIAMTAQALVDRGDWILMDEASWGVRVFKGFGTNVFSVRWDGDGPIIADVEAGVAAARDHGKQIKMFYTIPNFQNPLGITASVERRKAVLDLAIRAWIPDSRGRCLCRTAVRGVAHTQLLPARREPQPGLASGNVLQDLRRRHPDRLDDVVARASVGPHALQAGRRYEPVFEPNPYRVHARSHVRAHRRADRRLQGQA